MKEFHFYCLREEWIEFLRDAVEVNSLNCIFSKWYRDPNPPIYDKVNERVTAEH